MSSTLKEKLENVSSAPGGTYDTGGEIIRVPCEWPEKVGKLLASMYYFATQNYLSSDLYIAWSYRRI